MQYRVEFRYEKPDEPRPQGVSLADYTVYAEGSSAPIPDVGETVGFKSGETTKDFKVIARRFDYPPMGEGSCIITLTVANLDPPGFRTATMGPEAMAGFRGG